MHFPGTCRAGNTVILCPAATLRPRFRGSIRPSIRIEFGTHGGAWSYPCSTASSTGSKAGLIPFRLTGRRCRRRACWPLPGTIPSPSGRCWLVSMLFSAVIAFLEVYLFAFLGDLVDFLTAAEPRNLLAGPWHQAHRDGRGGAARSAAAELHFRVHFASGPARQLCHAHPLDGAPLCAAPEHGLLHQRLRRAASPPR